MMRGICMSAAGYITAWIAPRSELRLAIIMAVIQVALTAWAMSAFYDHAPLWAWLAGMVLMVPEAWLGAGSRAEVGPRQTSLRVRKCQSLARSGFKR